MFSMIFETVFSSDIHCVMWYSLSIWLQYLLFWWPGLMTRVSHWPDVHWLWAPHLSTFIWLSDVSCLPDCHSQWCYCSNLWYSSFWPDDVIKFVAILWRRAWPVNLTHCLFSVLLNSIDWWPDGALLCSDLLLMLYSIQVMEDTIVFYSVQWCHCYSDRCVPTVFSILVFLSVQYSFIILLIFLEIHFYCWLWCSVEVTVVWWPREALTFQAEK